MACFKDFLKYFWTARQTVVLILAPVVLLPLLLMFDSREARCGYGVALMVIYWVADALPYALTALLPLVIFPLLTVSSTAGVGQYYFQDSSMLVLGSLSLGVAMESCQLDRRLALWILMRTGSNPRLLMLGTMAVTWTLSLWLDTTSAVSLVIPVVSAVLRQLRNTKVKRSPSLLARQVIQRALTPKPVATAGQWKAILSPRRLSKRWEKRKSKEVEDLTQMIVGEEGGGGELLNTKMSPATSPATYRRISKGMSLCVAYAANIGAMGLLSGAVAPADLVMMPGSEEARDLFQRPGGVGSEVTFLGWLVLALPASLLCLLLVWFCLTLLFLGPREWRKKKRRDKVKDALVKETLLRQYQKLGRITFSERVVAGHYLVLLCALLAKSPPGLPGWSALFPPQMVGSSAAAILVSMSLFVFPAERPQSFCWRSGASRGGRVSAVLDWRSMQTNFPWAVLLLMGGGHAAIRMAQDSGLCGWLVREAVVEGVVKARGVSPWLLSLALAALISLLSQVTGGSATLNQLMPVLVQRAIDLEVNPLYFLIPCIMATFFTFMLPMATPPNAIVFATGHLEVKDMVLTGCVAHVLCALVVGLAVNTWGMAYFHFNTLPRHLLNNTLNVTLTSFPFTSTAAMLEVTSARAVFSDSDLSFSLNESNAGWNWTSVL